MLGLDEASVSFAAFRRMVHPNDTVIYDTFMRSVERLPQMQEDPEDQIHSMELRLRSADGEYHWYNYRYKAAKLVGADTPITRAEATVMLNNLLDVTDVPVEVFSSDSQGHWASQAAANLASSGVIRMESTGAAALSDQLTRAEAAEMLDGALDVLADREDGGWLPW